MRLSYWISICITRRNSAWTFTENNLNGAYVDGISITHDNPRQHVWTYMAALQEYVFHIDGQCECFCAPNSPVTD